MVRFLFIIISFFCCVKFPLSHAEQDGFDSKTAIGVPLGNKFWDVNVYYPWKEEFAGKEERYPYFFMEITNVTTAIGITDADTKTHKHYLYNYVDPEVTDFPNIDINLFEKILALKYFNMPEDERIAANRIDKFMATNYKTQTLPAKVYNSKDKSSKPFYLPELKDMCFDSVAKGKIENLRALLEGYNLLNIKDVDGNNLLSHAIIHHQYDIIDYLIKKQINVGIINQYGASLMTIAARSNNVYAVKALKDKCGIDHKDKFGNTPLDYSKVNNNKDLQKELS